MKKLKLLLPTLTISLGSCLLPCITSCACGTPTDLKIDGKDSIYLHTSTTFTALGLFDGKWEKTDKVEWSMEDPYNTGTTMINGSIYGGSKIGAVIVKATWQDEETTLTTSKYVFVVSPINYLEIKTPTVEKIHPNDLYKFEADIGCPSGFDDTVLWSIVKGQETGSTINQKGEFVGGSKEGEVTIRATSKFDNLTIDEYTFNMTNGPIISMELKGYDAVTIGQSATYTWQMHVEQGASEKCEWQFNDNGTGAKWNVATKTLTTDGAKPGTASLLVQPEADKTHSYTFNIKIADKFSNYQAIDSSNAKIISFDKDVSYIKQAIDPTCDISGSIYTVTQVGQEAFKEAKIKEIKLPDSITKIEKEAFKMTNDLTHIILNDNLTQIGELAFINSGVTEINFPKGITNIDIRAFEECKSLSTIDFSSCSKLEKINDQVFQFCSLLTNIVWPEQCNIKEIGYASFFNCVGLRRFTFPKTVTSIKASALYGCLNLQYIFFDGTMEEWKQIDRGNGWHQFVPANIVTCKDGTIELDAQ